MNIYSSVEVNTNIVEKSKEKIDLGQEFMATKSEVQMANSSVPTLVSEYFCTQPYVTFGQPFVTCECFLSLILLKDIRIDINSNHSLRVSTPNSKAVVNYMGHTLGLIHPCGRVYHELVPHNSCHIESGTRLAKICGRGVTFTSLNRSLIYLLDISGCKTTTERFRKLNYDFTADIFHSNSLTDDYTRQRTFADLSTCEVIEDGNDKIWYLAGLRIRQNMVSGDVMIFKPNGKIVMSISPSKSQLKINGPNLHIMASNNPECLLQVVKPHVRDEQRVVAALKYFRVKCGSQKAGFDGADQLALI